ncbi:MAG: hypothetical protein AAF988_00765 [Pseudomonadota bacterium]
MYRLLLLLLGCSIASSVHAAELKTIEEMKAHYEASVEAFKNENFSETQHHLERLVDQMRIRRMVKIMEHIPEPLPGWSKSNQILIPSDPYFGEDLVRLEIEQNYINNETQEEIELILSLGYDDFRERYPGLFDEEEFTIGEFKGNVFSFEEAEEVGKDGEFNIFTKNGAYYFIEGKNMTLETAQALLKDVDFEKLDQDAQ